MEEVGGVEEGGRVVNAVRHKTIKKEFHKYIMFLDLLPISNKL